ncbi:hypothetical protein [Sphingopyxis fribergensis]
MNDELRILNRQAMPDALDTLDARVLHALAVRQGEAATMRRTIVLAAFISLGGGVVAGSLVVPSAVAASPLTPFVPASPLDPHR